MTHLKAIACACLFAAFVACATHRTQQTVSPTPSPLPVHTATPAQMQTLATVAPRAQQTGGKLAPAASPAAVATATSAAIETPSASATATASPSAVQTVAASVAAQGSDPNGPPVLRTVHFNKTVVHGGDTIVGTITASLNVASVEIRIGQYGTVADKTGPGLFRVTYPVPNLPFFLRRTYTMDIIARNSRGDRSTREMPLTIR